MEEYTAHRLCEECYKNGIIKIAKSAIIPIFNEKKEMLLCRDCLLNGNLRKELENYSTITLQDMGMLGKQIKSKEATNREFGIREFTIPEEYNDRRIFPS